MNEIIFLVEAADEGGFIAKALGFGIFTEADDVPSLKENIRETIFAHFEEDNIPKVVRMHFVSEEVFSVA